MPTETTTRKKFYSCNGSQITFPFTFPISAEIDIVVKVRTDATGAVETLVLTTDYTVTKTGANWDSGGNVVTGDTHAAGKTLLIKRVTQQTQTKDYVEGDDFPAESHEEGLDKLTRIAHELQEESDRSMKMPDTDDEDLNMTLPNSVDRASKWLGFDADGQPTAVQTTPESVTVSPAAETVLDDATIAAMCATLGALDVNNDTLDDVPDGITYKKIPDQIDSSVVYEVARTEYKSIMPGAGASSDLAVIHGESSGILTLAVATAADWFMIPLPWLQDGLIITEMRVYASGFDAAEDVDVIFKRVNLGNGAGTDLLTVNLTTGDTEEADTGTHTLNTFAYGYCIEVDVNVQTTASIISIVLKYTRSEP